MQVTDPAGSPIAALDLQLRYGQPSRGAAYPSFMSVVARPYGSVLALWPAFEEVKLEPGALPGATGKPNTERPQNPPE